MPLGKWLHQFETSPGVLDLDAAREQAGIQQFLYARRPESVMAVINGGGEPTTLYEIFFTTEDWLGSESTIVNFVAFKQQGQYWVSLAGTENMYQWTQHAGGIFLRPNFNGTDALVNSFFDDMGTLVQKRLDATITDDISHATWNLSGHSLGGSAAYVMACRLKKKYPDATVNVMTFGEPRSLTENYDGPQPDTHHRIVTTGDAVAVLAPSNQAFGYRFVNPFKKNFGKEVDLLHHGQQHWLYLSGEFATSQEGAADPATASNYLPSSPFNHYIEHYEQLLFLNYQNNGGDPRGVVLQEITSPGLRFRPSPQVIKNFDLSAYLNAEQANTQLFPDAPGTITRDNFRIFAGGGLQVVSSRATTRSAIGNGASAMGVPSTYWKITAPVNNDNFGHTVGVIAQGSTDITSVYDVAKEFVHRYTNLLGNDLTSLQNIDLTIGPTGGSPMCEVVHITDAYNNRIGQPLKVTATGGRGFSLEGGNSPADVFTTALSFRLKGVAATVPNVTTSASTFTILGQPDAVVKNARYDQSVQLNKSGNVIETFQAQLLALLNFLTEPTNKIGFLGIDQTVPTKSTVSTNVTEGGEVKINSTAHGYNDGDVIQLLAVPKVWIGKYKVRKIDADSFALVGTKATIITVPSTAKFRLYRLASGVRKLSFFQYVAPPGGWEKNPPVVKVTKRNPARKITGVSFKRRAKK